MKLRILLTTFLASLAFFITPTDALAVIQSLNNQTGQTQTFQNDSNFSISSLNNVHSLIWQGLLPMSRGGTGVGSFNTGSILFSNGTTFAENNSNFFWNNVNNRLGIGTSSPASTLDVVGNALISGDFEVTGNIISANLVPYIGATDNVDLGENRITSDTNITTGGGFYGYNDAGLTFFSDVGITDTGEISTLSYANYAFLAQPDSTRGILNFSGVTDSNKTFTFPNSTGTFGLLEAGQTWLGLNKFEAGSNSTIYVGSLTKSGCIALGDSDNDGITYITANDGVLSASSTKPSICQ